MDTPLISLFTWNDAFLTHFPSVDAQHKRLVNILNEMADLVSRDTEVDPAAFAVLRDELMDYTRTHFADEESHMARAGLDSRHQNKHRAEHTAFIAEIRELELYTQSITLARARQAVDFLVHWLAYHILAVDQSMARQARSIRAGADASAAYDSDRTMTQNSTAPLLQALSGMFQTVAERNRELRALNQALEERVRQRTMELEDANRQLQILSTHDELTGLPNRRFAIMSLRQLWQESIRYKTPLSVLMLDADHFKNVNDRYGHSTGDALLRTLADRLRTVVRASDIVCRLGGDEFLILCPRTSRQGAELLVQRISDAQTPMASDDGTTYWDGRVSIGVAEISQDMEQPDALLEAADAELYAAKRTRKPSV